MRAFVFSTSTLIQGINMPFDIVWLDNFHFIGSKGERILGLKNLIGRAGRSNANSNSFDYGYVIVKERNAKTFSKRLNEPVLLAESSILDRDADIPDDFHDVVEAIINDHDFDDDLRLPKSQVTRLKSENVFDSVRYILDNLLIDHKPLKGSDYNKLSKTQKRAISDAFQCIFIEHLRRDELNSAEKSVLSVSIPILLWHIQGRSFREVVSLRYAYLSERDMQRSILAQWKKGEIPAEEARDQIKATQAHYSQGAASLPDSKLKKFPLFSGDTNVLDIDFDIVVYDTYDYLDKVISLSLTDPLSAAFKIYYDKTLDERALTMQNYIRYGTNDPIEIWLLRYGFGFEDIEWLKEYVERIDSTQIYFKETIPDLDFEKREVIKRYR
jgi:hypothetical protein